MRSAAGHIYHARDLSDPDIIVSFGLFDGTANELRAIQARHPSDNADPLAPRVAASRVRARRWARRLREHDLIHSEC